MCDLDELEWEEYLLLREAARERAVARPVPRTRGEALATRAPELAEPVAG